MSLQRRQQVRAIKLLLVEALCCSSDKLKTLIVNCYTTNESDKKLWATSGETLRMIMRMRFPQQAEKWWTEDINPAINAHKTSKTNVASAQASTG